MAFSKKHLDTIRNCYLLRPKGNRSKGFCCLIDGEVFEVEATEKAGRASIYFRRNFKDDLLSLIKEVTIGLQKNRITGASNNLAEAVVILCIAYRQISEVVTLEKVLSEFADIEATIFVGIPTMAVIMSDVKNFLRGVPVGRFVIGGNSNVEHYKRFEKHSAEHNENERNGPPKSGAWIMREPLTCRVISAAFDESLSSEARDSYLALVTANLSKQFKSDFEADQSIPAALGAAVIDSDVLFGLEDLQLKIDFGILGISEYTIVKSGAGLSIPDNLSEMGEKDAVAKRLIAGMPLGSCPDIDRLLETYSRFLLKAKSHETSSRPSEAFIHYVFALDLALGGKSDTTKNTTRRSAAIYSGASGTPFKSAEKELRALFDARSKYVHEGIEITEQDFILLRQICGMVTECLLRSRHATLADNKRFVSDYLYPRLDLVVAAMNAGVELGDGIFYKECGIKQPAKAVSSEHH